MWKLVLGHASMTSNQQTKALSDWTTVSHDILNAFLNKKKAQKFWDTLYYDVGTCVPKLPTHIDITTYSLRRPTTQNRYLIELNLSW